MPTDVVVRGVRRVIHTLDTLKWKGTSMEYARLSQAANILASAIGARSTLVFRPRKKRTKKKGKKKGDK